MGVREREKEKSVSVVTHSGTSVLLPSGRPVNPSYRIGEAFDYAHSSGYGIDRRKHNRSVTLPLGKHKEHHMGRVHGDRSGGEEFKISISAFLKAMPGSSATSL